MPARTIRRTPTGPASADTAPTTDAAAGGATGAAVALEGCRIWRPAFGGARVEIVSADARPRAFPLRVTETLGICLTALFLARDAPIFGVMQGMIGMALITAVVFALTLASRR